MTARHGVEVLVEQEIRLDFRRLAAAWTSRASVVVLPDKLGVDVAWMDSALARIPSEFHTGHFLMLTSGSTGVPKLVIGSKTRAEALVRVLHEVQSNEPVRQGVLSLPISYSYSFVNQWLWSHVHAVPLVATSGVADPRAFVGAMRAADAGMLCLVGVQVPMILDYVGSERFPGIIRVNFAGGRFPQERIAALRETFPNALIFNNFGCAEAMPRLTVRRADDSDDAANIGRPIRGVSLRLDSGGDLLFQSEYGAVAVLDGAGLVRPVAPDEWLATGDQAESCPDGSWRLVGRRSEVFKRYGEKVSLQSLLALVLASWRGQAAFYRERDSRGEEGHVLVLSPAASEEDAREVVRQLSKQYPRAAWPIRIESVEVMPTLSTQKIDTGALAAAAGKQILWSQRL
jgi:acyl-CoA synthetase (AMP-forming)/AMP-acid ligase II